MVFGKYCLLELISVGGMAEVFRAKPLPAHQSDKLLALKRILPHLAEDDEFITMFVDEAKLAVRLEHPNIVETYELGNFQSSYYILMEYIAGQDVLELQKRLRRRRRIMSVAQACFIASKVARGLHHAHTARDDQGRPFNIIHRDVSPQNIRLTWDGRVKLIDFGIAKAAVQRTKTQVGVLKGKFGYMSPEQVRGDSIDHRSDVFALGTTLWEMLTNRRLFNGDNEYETLQMVKHPEVEPPGEKNRQVPREVDGIVMRALRGDRDRRFQTALEFAEALEEFLGGLRESYTRRDLAGWMAETFSDELEEERRKRELFREIKTVQDVRWFNRAYAEDPEQVEEVSGESVVGEGKSEETVWDPDFAPENLEEVDHEAFVSEHTAVAAGGFDPATVEEEEDERIALSEEDLVEVYEREPAPGAGDGSPRGEGEEGESIDVEELTERYPGRFALASATGLVAVLLVVMSAIIWQRSGSGARTAETGGSLVVDLEPRPEQSGTIAVDGTPRAEAAPASIRELEARRHEVEVEFPGFEPATRKVDLTDGGLKTLTVGLDEKGDGGAVVRLEVPGAVGDVRAFVDGERRTLEGGAVSVEVAPGLHLLEALAPGRRPWSRVVEVDGSDDRIVERVEWKEAGLDLRIESQDPAEVEFDGEIRGETPVTVEDLRADEIHNVRLDALEGGEVWESGLGFPELGERTLSVSFDDGAPSHGEREFGWLTVSTGESWWSVDIDGAATGQTTPIEEDGKLPVREGERTITLRRGTQLHEFDVELVAGETVSLSEDLPFEWSGGSGL